MLQSVLQTVFLFCLFGMNCFSSIVCSCHT
jgi:hypothetical protein